MAEQFIGQELVVSQGAELYYWAREARGSTAEVDYLTVVQGAVHGVEVKIGAAGFLKSLHLLLRSYPNVASGLVFSSAPYAELASQKLTFLPLYWALSATGGFKPEVPLKETLDGTLTCYASLPMAAGTRQTDLRLGGEQATPAEPAVLGVAELDRALKRLLEASTADVRVRGEISDLHLASSGHAYFSLKDESEPALIECVMYRTAPARARRLLVEGASVVLRGRVTVYPPRGRMQLVAEDVLGTARGAQLEALERLKAKLATEGLFAPERKRPLPAEPRLVAVLTSRDGAAIHDVVRVAFRRGRVRVLLVPTPVQGAEAAEPIAAAVRLADGLGADVMIVTRGGGSLDDLAAYNDERVVRAVAAARTVVVSAVGHEIDTTLCDLASDARAATPSQAAELVVPDQAERLAALASLGSRLAGAMRHRLTSGRERLTRLRAGLGEPRRRVLEEAQRWDELGARLERAMRLRLRRHRSALDEGRRRLGARHPRAVLAAARARLGPLDPRLRAAVQRRLQALRHELGAGTARLDALSPLGVLGRGYAIATSEDGRVLRDAGEVAAGDGVGVRLHRGRLETRVERAVKG